MRSMTKNEMKIIDLEVERQEHFYESIVSNKSFVGTMASIAAFVVIEWLKTNPHFTVAIMAIVLLLGSAGLFIKLTSVQDFKYPAESEEWISWRERWANDLIHSGHEDTSDADLEQHYYERALSTLAHNRYLNTTRQREVLWAGRLSVACISIVVLETALRTVFS